MNSTRVSVRFRGVVCPNVYLKTKSSSYFLKIIMKCKSYLVSIALCIISEEKVNRTAKKCGIEKALNIIVDECDDRATIMYKFEDDPS